MSGFIKSSYSLVFCLNVKIIKMYKKRPDLILLFFFEEHFSSVKLFWDADTACLVT